MYSLILAGCLLLAGPLLLAGCGNNPASRKEAAKPIDKEAYEQLIASGPTATDAEIQANQWASSVKEAGYIRIGGSLTSQLFGLYDEADEDIRGFDAGISQMLTRYIFGDASKYELIQVEASTRESVLENGEADVVCNTYSITDARKKIVSFAGPYYASRQAILLKADNKDINGVKDLAGKTVSTQSGSTGPEILFKYAPDAAVMEYGTDAEARLALEQGVVDAYVTDYNILLNAMIESPDLYRLAKDQFGPEDDYGIGLPKDSDGVAFVNSFLKTITEDGTWEKLWQVCIGDRTGVTEVPPLPEIGE